jgi:hypothetical protein
MVYALTYTKPAQVSEILFFKQYKSIAPGSIKCNLMRIKTQMKNVFNIFNIKKTFEFYKKIYKRNAFDIQLIKDIFEKENIRNNGLQNILLLRRILLLIPSEIRSPIYKILVKILYNWHSFKKKFRN